MLLVLLLMLLMLLVLLVLLLLMLLMLLVLLVLLLVLLLLVLLVLLMLLMLLMLLVLLLLLLVLLMLLVLLRSAQTEHGRGRSGTRLLQRRRVVHAQNAARRSMWACVHAQVVWHHGQKLGNLCLEINDLILLGATMV